MAVCQDDGCVRHGCAHRARTVKHNSIRILAPEFCECVGDRFLRFESKGNNNPPPLLFAKGCEDVGGGFEAERPCSIAFPGFAGRPPNRLIVRGRGRADEAIHTLEEPGRGVEHLPGCGDADNFHAGRIR